MMSPPEEDVLCMILFVGSVLVTKWVTRLHASSSSKENLGFIRRFRHAERNHPPQSKEQVLALRKRHFSKSLSISYENSDPLMMVEARGCYMTDEAGRDFLDTRNNVAHVGHCHPVVTQAVQEQVAQVNTNTRYLHPIMAQLAARLTTQWGLPSNLHKVFFCNSGSEANDLALRLARAHYYHYHRQRQTSSSENDNKNRQTLPQPKTIVVDHAYHGHTLATLAVSPYKYAKKTGTEVNDTSNTIAVPCPDAYRGPHQDLDTAGPLYAQAVRDVCRDHPVSAMIIEGGMSVAGVIVPPRGYLKNCRQALTAAGALWIADEVQTGLGRLGEGRWAFQCHDDDVSPDIVTLGKPMGNGMPLAAVVTTSAVAAAFEDCGIEYFNTFGGNPVCAAAGLAVLDVLRDERLPQQAAVTGQYLRDEFQRLADTTVPLIGHVRGAGLFVGVELVRDRGTKTPATAETSIICSALKSRYCILTSIDGPHDNVLVIKPPLVFGKEQVRHFINCFERAVTVDLASYGDLSKAQHTPT